MKNAVSRMRGVAVAIGKITAGNASTSQMLAMLEPMMLPCARPGLSASAAWMPIRNSGIDVPKPTMRMPTSSGETFALYAAASAPRTRQSPE